MESKIILCVDDEKIVLDSLKAQLYQIFGNNFEYEFAESAEEALEILEELQEDSLEIWAVVSDWQMPGMKGDEFLIEIQKRLPQCIKILLTGQAEQAAIERAKKQAKLQAYIAKPWDALDLEAALKKGISK